MTEDSSQAKPPWFRPLPRRLALLLLCVATLISIGLAWRMMVLLPNEFSTLAFGHLIQVGELRRRVFGRIFTLGLILPAIFAIELFVVGWAQSSARQLLVQRSPSSLTDLACFVISQTPFMRVLGVAASLGITLISARWLGDMLHQYTVWHVSLGGLPFLLQLVAYFLAFSFFDYWSHRLDHTSLFWPLHRYHHSADGFCILSGVRLHPAAFTSLVQQIVPAVLLGASLRVIVDVNLFVLALQYLIHSQIGSDFGWVGRYVIQSPTHHRSHHRRSAGRQPGHYGLVPIWDRLFGTWLGAAEAAVPIGVAAPYRHGAWILPDLWRDYREFWAGIFRRAPAGS